MNIAGVNSTDPISLSSDPESQEAGLGKDTFLKLLVTQLQNQDPLAPAKNEDMLAQLAQFSSLEQMQDLNDNIVGLAVLQQSNALMSQLTNSSALIGKSVEYVDPTSGEAVWGTVSSVRIKEGLAILNIGGEDVPLASVTEIGTDPGIQSTPTV